MPKGCERLPPLAPGIVFTDRLPATMVSLYDDDGKPMKLDKPMMLDPICLVEVRTN